MARFGRIDSVLQKPNGAAALGVDIEVRRQGANIVGNQSGTSPHAFTVDDPGGIRAGDTVAVGTGTTTYSVSAVSPTSVTLSGFGGTLSLTDGSRLTPTNNLPTLYTDRQGNATQSQPLQTSTPFGQFGCYVKGGEYDLLASGSGFGKRLYKDWYVPATHFITNALDDAAEVGFIFSVSDLLAASGSKVISVQNADGTEIFSIDAAGTISTTNFTVASDLTVPGILTVDGDTNLQGLVVAVDAQINGALNVVGATTVNDLTVSGTLTIPDASIAASKLVSSAFGTMHVDDDTADYTLTGSYVALPNTSITFTPASSSSKLLVLAVVPAALTTNGGAGATVSARIMNGSTVLHEVQEAHSDTSSGTRMCLSLVAVQTGLTGAQTFTLEVKKGSAEGIKVLNSTDQKARIVVFELQ